MRAAEATLVNARAEFGRSEQLLRIRVDFARWNSTAPNTAYSVAQENHEAARQMLEQGAIGREEDIQAKEAEVRGLEGRVVEANLQLRTPRCARPTTA